MAQAWLKTPIMGKPISSSCDRFPLEAKGASYRFLTISKVNSVDPGHWQGGKVGGIDGLLAARRGQASDRLRNLSGTCSNVILFYANFFLAVTPSSFQSLVFALQTLSPKRGLAFGSTSS
jgi:hypothetical protein